MIKASDIFSREVLIDGESQEELSKFKTAVEEGLKPEGVIEELCVNIIVAESWKMRRLLKYESEVFGSKDKFNSYAAYKDIDLVPRFIKYKECTENSIYKASNELKKLKKGDKSTPQSSEI